MGKNEASLGALRVKTSLERADETKVGVFAQALGRIGDGVVEESIRGGIGHERRQVQTET
jgi:hypothetical protein